MKPAVNVGLQSTQSTQSIQSTQSTPAAAAAAAANYHNSPHDVRNTSHYFWTNKKRKLTFCFAAMWNGAKQRSLGTTSAKNLTIALFVLSVQITLLPIERVLRNCVVGGYFFRRKILKFYIHGTVYLSNNSFIKIQLFLQEPKNIHNSNTKRYNSYSYDQIQTLGTWTPPKLDSTT